MTTKLVVPKTCKSILSTSSSSTSSSKDDVVSKDDTLLLLSDYIRIVMYLSSIVSLMCIIVLRLGNNNYYNQNNKINNKMNHNNNKQDILTKARGDQNINEMKKDELGITMGSLLPSLTLLSLLISFTNNMKPVNHIMGEIDLLQIVVYIALCSSVGLAFSLSCLITIIIIKYKKYQQLQIIRMKDYQPQELSGIASFRFRILLQMLFFIIYFICIAIMIQITIVQRSNKSTLTTSENESKQHENVVYITTYVVFSILQSILVYIYYNNDNNGYDYFFEKKNTKKVIMATTTSKDSRTNYAPTTILQKVFTLGEWMSISSFLSLFITHYIIQYWFYPNYSNIDIQRNNDDSMNYNNLSYMTVAYTGIIGCIIGCIIPISTILSSVSSSVSESNWKIIIGLRICIVVMITLLIMNHALQHHYYEKWDRPILLYHNNMTNGNSFKKSIIQWIDNRTDSTLIAIRWLIHFLMTTEGRNNPYMMVDDKSGRDNTIRTTIFHQLYSVPRYIWLIYWMIVLICTIPISILIAKKMISLQQQNNNDNNPRKKTENMTILIVVARKYFHFIALLLFGLPTYYAPSLMYLSYAIATALLIFMERLRFDYVQSLSSSTSRTGFAVGNDKAQSIETRFVGQQPPSSFISFDQFFQTFFDEKDLGAKEGGFVVTHIALIVGCAIPLWFQHYYLSMNKDASSLSSSSLIHILMPYLGIITLGVGDAAGAIYGSFYGKMRWPESKRSVEGSIVMLVSMLVSVYILFELMGVVDCRSSKMIGSILLILVPVVMLEAATSQIDNFCLPLFAVILCSLVH